MSIKIEELCPSFPSIDNAAFRRKIYETCSLFAMENYDILRKTQSEDMFPSEKFYTLEDQTKGVKTTKKSNIPPKKKRTPIRKSTKSTVVEHEENTDEEDSHKEEKKSEKATSAAFTPQADSKKVQTLGVVASKAQAYDNMVIAKQTLVRGLDAKTRAMRGL